MKIPGWMYIIIGAIISVMSGIIYLKVPKNGEPNMAMALFFFIGMVFIIVGVIKFFFVKMSDEQEIQYAKASKEIQHNRPNVQNPKAINSETNNDAHINRVEAQINRIYSQQQPTQSPNTQHTSHYAKSHPYNHTYNPQTHHTTAHTHSAHNQPSNVASSMSISVCKKCGNKNPTTANYCHQCGHGLR
jgi:ribosomal protein L40E